MGNLIVKDNALIEASHKLGEVEQRLILLAIVKARSMGDTVEQLKDKELVIHADDYIEIFNVTKSVACRALKKAVMGLFEAKWGYKYIDDKGLERVRYERFTQSADYGRDDGKVKFVFASAIIPFLVELERRFTSYEIEQVAELSSGYAMRLYEFLIQRLDKKTGKGWLAISLEDLRFRFGLLPTQYQAMCDFKKGVLDLAVSQINEHTDLITHYTQKKRGRVIVGFHFEFEYKTPKNIADNDELGEQDDLIPQNEQEQEIVAENNAYADSINATEKHRKNLVRKALREHRQAEKERIARLEAEQQAELERKKQAELAEQERRKKEQAKQAMLEAENQAFIAYFESLPSDEKKQILDDVQKIILGAMTKGFKQARSNNTAHTLPMYRKFFKQVMDL